MFITFEASKLSVAPGPFNTLQLPSEPSEFGYEDYRAVTQAALRDPEVPFTWKASENPHPFLPLLQPKKPQPAKLGLISKLVTQMLRAFPERRMNEDSCPSFIHHSMFRRPVNIGSMEDPIIICQDIIRKFAMRNNNVNSSVWDAISTEQERLYDQRGSFDKWLHLLSAQAVTMYLLMLAAAGGSVLNQHPNLTITLLFTLGTNFEKLNLCHLGFTSREERNGNTPAWEDWIFAESKLRTAAVYFILARHFDVNFGLPCDREGDYTFEDVDLPAEKVLWEARTEKSWREEFVLMNRAQQNSVPVRTNEERLKYADLIKCNRQQCENEYSAIQKDESRLANRVEEWQKGVDEFGMLVALCSTLSCEDTNTTHHEI